MLYHSFFCEFGFDNRLEPGCARILQTLGYPDDYDNWSSVVKLRDIILLIMDIQAERDSYDENLNGKSFDELEEKYEVGLMTQQMRMDRRIEKREYQRNPNYRVIEIESYEQASAFAGHFRVGRPWTCCISEEDYQKIRSRQNQIFFCLSRDFRDAVETASGETVWSSTIDYDDLDMADEVTRPENYNAYGLSMLMVVIGSDGRLL